jgi:hypothetical protein
MLFYPIIFHSISSRFILLFSLFTYILLFHTSYYSHSSPSIFTPHTLNLNSPRASSFTLQIHHLSPFTLNASLLAI